MEPPKDKTDKLVSDENFVQLMEGEFNRAGKPVDELAKKRVWDRLQKETKSVSPGGSGNIALARKLQMFTLLAAGLGAVFVSLRFFEQPVEDAQRIKGKLGDITFQVGMYEQKADGELLPYGVKSKRQPGLTIVPFVKCETEAVVLLVKKIADNQYEAVSDAEMTSGGEEHYFSKDGETNAVETEAVAETYCAVIADSMNAMGTVVSSLPAYEPQDSAVMECFSL